jgi:hypothetical protein
MFPMRVPLYLASALALLAASASNAQTPALPAAPQVTVGADLKQLIFDWSPVPSATYYQVLVNADGHSGFVPLGSQIPAAQTRATLSIAVHLQRWQTALYIVSACNAAGCRDSAQIFPRDQMLDTIGYLKSSNSDPGDNFGSAVVLSNDGSTLAVTAQWEASTATGVNGDQSDNSSSGEGAVYVFRRVSGHWRQEAYIKGPAFQPFFGTSISQYQQSIALSGDGSLLAVGQPRFDGSEGAQGEVSIFRRASAGSWSQTATLHAPELVSAGNFGQSLDLTLDGLTLKVMARQPRQSDGVPIGTTYIFKRTSNTWTLTDTIAPYYPGDRCDQVRMSTDGNTLVSNCLTPDPSLPNGGTYRIITLKRTGSSWVHMPDISFPTYSYSSQPFALNFAGTKMALVEGEDVVVYRWSGAAWSREMLIARPALTSDEGIAWGEALAFDKNGTMLAIGDYSSAAGGQGVMTAVTQGSTNDGAVFMYAHTSSTTAPWQLRSVVKAPNPGDHDNFGYSLALCGTGRTLAVGAFTEDSAARGIDGDQSSEGAPDSGAVYLY